MRRASRFWGCLPAAYDAPKSGRPPPPSRHTSLSFSCCLPSLSGCGCTFGPRATRRPQSCASAVIPGKPSGSWHGCRGPSLTATTLSSRVRYSQARGARTFSTALRTCCRRSSWRRSLGCPARRCRSTSSRRWPRSCLAGACSLLPGESRGRGRRGRWPQCCGVSRRLSAARWNSGISTSHSSSSRLSSSLLFSTS